MEISRSVEVHATPEAAYARVSDLPRMGDLSNENRGGRWVGGATGPAVGARFKGRNSNGIRRWSTKVTVVAADPGSAFAFDISYVGIPVSRWRYTFLPTAGGCTVTESWTDRRPGWFKGPAGVATGVMDREAATARSIEHTLAQLKAALEG
ncbi:MAG TPA: SRPBCC family protein [Mycobacteriales bacterium]|nr:SRPBCC family protein [Mycobacteriales bacterium]